jgi:hypothetical protein
LPLRDGGFRIYYEARLSDESHELRTELVPPQTGRRPQPVVDVIPLRAQSR